LTFRRWSNHGRDFSSIYIVRELWGLQSEVVQDFPEKLSFWKKTTPYGEIFTISSRKDSSRHRLYANFVKFGEISRCLPDKKNKISIDLSLWLLRRSRPKCVRASGKQFTQERPKFHPNRFTSGGVIAERLNTVQARHKVFRILGEATASSPSNNNDAYGAVIMAWPLREFTRFT